MHATAQIRNGSIYTATARFDTSARAMTAAERERALARNREQAEWRDRWRALRHAANAITHDGQRATALRGVFLALADVWEYSRDRSPKVTAAIRKAANDPLAMLACARAELAGHEWAKAMEAHGIIVEDQGDRFREVKSPQELAADRARLDANLDKLRSEPS